MRHLVWTIGLLTACATPRDATIPDRLRTCASAEDCASVAIACDQCCRFTGVTATARQEAQELVARQCASWTGSVCDCITVVTDVACTNGLCTVTTAPADVE